MKFEDLTPSGARWRQIYASGEPPVVLKREGLVRRILLSDSPWIAIAAAPGMGKSTVLGQAAAALEESGRDVLLLPLYSRRTPPQALVDALAAGSVGPGTAVLIDDFDWFDLAAGADWLVEELLGSGARLITASVDSPAASVAAAHAPELIGPSDLVLTRAEHTALFAAAELGPESSLAEELVWRIARGGAAGTMRCLDWLVSHPGDLAGVPEAYDQLTSVSLIISLNDVPEDSTGHGMLAGGKRIRLLPQLSIPLVSSFLGAEAADALEAFVRQPTVLEPVRARRNFYEWSESFWNAFRNAELDDRDARRSMAEELERLGAELDELWQRLLLHEWPRAERLLASHYLQAETLLPAVVAEDLAGRELDGFPLCAALQMSVEPGATRRESRPRARAFVRIDELAEDRGTGRGAEPGTGVDGEAPAPEYAATVRALQARAAIRLGDPGSAGERLEQSWALLRAVPPGEREGHRVENAVALLARVLADLGRFGSAWRALLWMLRRTELLPDDQELLHALESVASQYRDAGGPGMPRPGTGVSIASAAGALAVERGVPSAAWVLIDAGEPRLAAELVAGWRADAVDSPAVGIADGAGLLGRILDGRAGEAVEEFERIQAERSASSRNPLVVWMGALARLALGQRREAAELIAGLPEDWELTILAAQHFQLIVGTGGRPVEDRRATNRLGPRGRGIAALVRTIGLLREGFAERAMEALLQAQAIAGPWAVGLALRVVPAGDIRQLLDALDRTAPEGAVIRPGEGDVRVMLAARLEEPEVFPAPERMVELTEREMIILAAIDRGLSLAEIASAEFVSVNTVKSQIISLKRKLGVTGPREAAVEEAVRLGLLRGH